MDSTASLHERLTPAVVTQLGYVLPLSAAQCAALVQALVPLELDALSAQEATAAGREQLARLLASPFPAGVQPHYTNSDADVLRLQRIGGVLAPTLLEPQVTGALPALAHEQQVDTSAVRLLAERLLALLLTFLLSQDEPYGAPVGGRALLGETVLTTVPQVIIQESTPLTPSDTASSAPPPAERHRGLAWWWLVPLLALLGLGGCYLLRGSSSTLSVTSPANGSVVNGPFTFTGSATPGEAVTVSEQGSPVSSATTSTDGHFTVSLPTPTDGPHTYTVAGPTGQSAITRTVTVRDNSAAASGAGAVPAASGAAPSTPSTADATSSSAGPASTTSVATSAPSVPGATATGTAGTTSAGTGTSSTGTAATSSAVSTPAAAGPVSTQAGQPGTAGTSAAAGAPSSGSLSLAAPAEHATLLADAVVLRGEATPGSRLTVTEDGNSLGEVQTASSGTWTFRVPSPAAGQHTYSVASGSQTLSRTLTVRVGQAQAGSCQKAFSVSLSSGQQVRAPFRFGGVGSARGYDVTVSRGTRRIGFKTLPLDGSCGWSYTSDPGRGRVTYTLRREGSRAVLRRLTLLVR